MLDICITAYYPIPKNAGKRQKSAMLAGDIRPAKKPDWDNVGKVICDALNNIAYKDDSQIVDARVRKYYSYTPEIVVAIKNINGGTLV